MKPIGLKKQKVVYIHNNPVQDKTVSLPEDYYFSSARNFAGLDNDLEVILLDLFGHGLQIRAIGGIQILLNFYSK